MEHELTDLLRIVANGFQARMQQQIAAEGIELTVFQARLINLVGRNAGVSQLALAASTDRDKAQVARTIGQLAARGLIERTPHPTDWRVKCLSLTAAGRDMHQQLQQLRQQLAAGVLGRLSAAERQGVRHGLAKMAAALQD